MMKTKGNIIFIFRIIEILENRVNGLTSGVELLMKKNKVITSSKLIIHLKILGYLCKRKSNSN